MKLPKRPTDRRLAIWWSVGFVVFQLLRGIVSADASLPLPKWDAPKMNESVSLGVIPAKRAGVELVGADASGVAEGRAEDLEDILQQGQMRLHVNKAFQLYMPPRTEPPQNSSELVKKQESPLQRLSVASVVSAIEQTGLQAPLVYLGKSRGASQLTNLKRFTRYMQGELGEEFLVLLLDENQGFETGLFWDEVFKLYSKLELGKLAIFVVGQRDELLKVVLPSERVGGFDETRWITLIQQTERELSTFKGSREEVPLQVLMKLTTALHQMEGWKSTSDLEKVRQEIPKSLTLQPSEENFANASKKITTEVPQVSLVKKEVILEKETSTFPWLGSGLAIGMGGIALLAWKITSRLGAAVLEPSPKESAKAMVIESSLSSSAPHHPMAYVASYKKHSVPSPVSVKKAMNKNMD